MDSTPVPICSLYGGLLVETLKYPAQSFCNASSATKERIKDRQRIKTGVTVRVTPEVKAQWQAAATSQGVALSAWIVAACANCYSGLVKPCKVIRSK